MDRERLKTLTRAGVFQVGLLTLLLGAISYGAFIFFGFEEAFAGIAAQLILILVILVWVVSYLLRVVTGKMTFMEQRKRYLKVYEELTDTELQEKYDSMSDEEKIALIQELESDKNL